MNVANCRRLVALLVYCGVAVLVIANGQPTTDDDIDKDEINKLIDSKLIDIVAELKAGASQVRPCSRRAGQNERPIGFDVSGAGQNERSTGNDS